MAGVKQQMIRRIKPITPADSKDDADATDVSTEKPDQENQESDAVDVVASSEEQSPTSLIAKPMFTKNPCPSIARSCRKLTKKSILMP